MSAHEYSVVGHSRSKIGMYIAFASGLVAGVITTVAGLVMSYLQSIGWISLPSIVVWPVTGGVVFGILFLIFDKVAWKWKRLHALVGVPDISGAWTVTGSSFDQNNSPKAKWNGRIEITQFYEKITVWLKTEQSESSSISAAIINEGRAGFRLIYSYRNQPRPGESDLQSHIGHCELLFNSDLDRAEGGYFNGGGRFTHGTMLLVRG